MMPELTNMTYEDRLREIGLPTLEQRRESGDLITLFKIVNGMDRVYREDLVTAQRVRGLRGHDNQLSKGVCLKDIKKYSFPHRSIDKWNKLDRRVVEARNIHQMKTRLDICRYGDGTIGL